MILNLTYLTSKQLNDDTSFSRAHTFSWLRAAQYFTFCILFYRQFFDFLFSLIQPLVWSVFLYTAFRQLFGIFNLFYYRTDSSNNNRAILYISLKYDDVSYIPVIDRKLWTSLDRLKFIIYLFIKFYEIELMRISIDFSF